MKRRRDFLCLCLDITDHDLDRAIVEGYTHAELLKRYTGTFMGPCQGKSCMDTVLRRLAEKLGVSPDQVGRTTMRPPAHPVQMSTIAGLDSRSEER